MQAGAIDGTEALFEQAIAHLMQPSGRLPQSRLDDHDGAVRCEKRQKLSDNRSPLCRRVNRCREQFIQTIRHNDEIIRPAPHNLLTEIPFQWMLQVALHTAKACVGYSNLVAVGLPQFLSILQRGLGRIGRQDRYRLRPFRTAMP